MSHRLTLADVTLNVQKLIEMLRTKPKLLETWKIQERATSHFFQWRDEITGVVIKPPGWNYAIVVDDQGKLHYDNYNGIWGNMKDVALLVSLALAYEAVGTLESCSMVDQNGTLTLSIDTPSQDLNLNRLEI